MSINNISQIDENSEKKEQSQNHLLDTWVSKIYNDIKTQILPSPVNTPADKRKEL